MLNEISRLALQKLSIRDTFIRSHKKGFIERRVDKKPVAVYCNRQTGGRGRPRTQITGAAVKTALLQLYVNLVGTFIVGDLLIKAFAKALMEICFHFYCFIGELLILFVRKLWNLST